MPAIVLLTHMPLVRIDEDEIPFAEGELWRLPYEQYDQLSLGVFADSQPLYERTTPVFLRHDLPDAELPGLREGGTTEGGRMAELKAPTKSWELLPQLGFGFIAGYHETVVDPAWTALLLAAPASAMPQPRLSVTFVVRGEEQAYFEINDVIYDGVRVQGDADQELLFSPRATGSLLPRSTIERANELQRVVAAARGNAKLSAAVDALGATTHPSLSRPDQMALAATALEALLLPEVTSGIEATFARRLAALLAADDADQKEIEDVAHELYDARSARLHGESHRPSAEIDVIGDAWAQRLLAAAVVALTERVTAGGDIDEICAALDDGSRVGGGSIGDTVGQSPPDRLATREPYRATGWSTTGSLEPPEGNLLTWSPLVGLRCDEPFRLAEHTDELGGGIVIMSLDAAEVMSMEDKDVRRDMSSLQFAEQAMASLAVGSPTDALPSLPEEDAAIARLLRVRDLGVATLRLAGFAEFVDPELLGSYAFNGPHRTVQPTVLRQTILGMMAKDPDEAIRAEDHDRLLELWGLLSGYETQARTADVDTVLELFRRCNDRQFLPGPARAGLMIAVLEAMLGRFRPRDDPVKLEQLVRAVAGDHVGVDWFVEKGRDFRNSVAHGYWDGSPEPLEQLLEVLRALVPAYVRAWVECDERDERRPTRVLVEQATASVRG